MTATTTYTAAEYEVTLAAVLYASAGLLAFMLVGFAGALLAALV